MAKNAGNGHILGEEKGKIRHWLRMGRSYERWAARVKRMHGKGLGKMLGRLRLVLFI
jgi:hypothetical protein